VFIIYTETQVRQLIKVELFSELKVTTRCYRSYIVMTQTGVLINLSAKGVQNVYLDLSPQYTFFKRSFRRHTNYAVQAVMVAASNQIGFGRTITFPIPRNGDLLAETYFCAYLPCCGVDTTPNMYAKANRGVVTNKGIFGPAHNVMDSRLTNPTFSKPYHHRVDSSAVNADGTINGASAVSATTANVNAGGSVGAFGAQSGAIERVKGKAALTGGGKIGVPSRVSSAPGLETGLAASINTAADTQMAQQFLTGDDHANVGYVNALGHAMIQEAEFSVGGNSINKFSGEYMHIWHLMHNKSGDPSSDDNLFMYGDGVGAPMHDGGSAAPHAIVEHQNPLLNELSRYKLARFELKLPKSNASSGGKNEPAYEKKVHKLLSASGNQFPTAATNKAVDTNIHYSVAEKTAIDEANAAGLDGPVLKHNQLLSLNFLRHTDLQDKTSHYLTAAERARCSINTTYRVKFYKNNGTEELPEAVAKCYLIGQAGTNHPVMPRRLQKATGNHPGKLAPPAATGSTALVETPAAAWKKHQMAQLMPWSDDVLKNSVTVGVCDHTRDFIATKQAIDADMSEGVISDQAAEDVSVYPTRACYAYSDQTPIPGVREVREVIFGLGQMHATYDSNGAITHVKHVDMDPIFLQKWYKNAANGAASTEAYRDFDSTDVTTPIVGKAALTLSFGTWVPSGAVGQGGAGYEGIEQYTLKGNYFGTYTETFTELSGATLGAGLGMATDQIVRTESGFCRGNGANQTQLGLENPENVAAFYRMAAKINEQFGKWFTCTVEFSEKPRGGGANVVSTGAIGQPELRKVFYSQNYAIAGNEKSLVGTVSGMPSGCTGIIRPAPSIKDATKKGTIVAVSENRFTRYAKLVFTGTDLLRRTHGRLHISVGPIADGTPVGGTAGTDEGKGVTGHAHWLSKYNPRAPTSYRALQANGAAGSTSFGSPILRFERVGSRMFFPQSQTKSSASAVLPVTQAVRNMTGHAANSNVIIPSEEMGYASNGCIRVATMAAGQTVNSSFAAVTDNKSILNVETAAVIVGPSVGVPDYIPDRPSPDAIGFVLYNKVGPNERVIDTATSTDSAVEITGKIKFEKVNTTNAGIGFNTTSDNLWVKTSASSTAVPHAELIPAKGKAADGAGSVHSGLVGAVHIQTSLQNAGTKGFAKDKYRCTVPGAAAGGMGAADTSAAAVDGIPLLGPTLLGGTTDCYLDPLSFHESCSNSRVNPLSSAVGYTGTGGFGATGTEWDSSHGLFNSDSTQGAGSHQYLSFVGLCPDLIAGTTGTRRASDNQLGMADDTALSASSLGRVQNKALTTKANVTATANAVSGTWPNNASVTTRSADARKGTMTALSAQGQEATRGWDKRHDIATATDTSSWKAVDHTGRRYWRTDYTKVASSEGAVAHRLRNDFVTTSSHASGTVALSVGSKKAIRDGYAKRCHMSAVGNADHPEGTGRCVKVMVPLPFWYTRSGNKVSESGRTQVLPIIALQYHDCKVNIKLRSQTDIVQTDHEARNIGLRCTGMHGLGGSLISGGVGAQTLDATAKAELKTMVQDSVLTTAAMNGGFAFQEKPTDARLTYQGNKVAYGTQIAAWGGPGKKGAPCKNDTGDDILQAWRTGQSLQTDMGARSCAVPYASGTGYPLTAAGNAGELIDAYLLAQTVFLDSNERRLFASHTHEYLITQVQEQEFHLPPQTAPEFQMLTLSCKLNFNHPVSQMYWVCQRPESRATRNWFRYEATHMGGDDLMVKAALSLNSHDREDSDQADAMFSRVIQPQTYFNTAPAGGAGGTLRDPSEGGGKNIYMYSFAAHPKEWWPSGNLNLSRIDTATLKLSIKGHASQAHMGHQYTYAGGGYHKLADEIEFAAEAAGLTPQQKLACYYGTLNKGVDVRVYVQNYNIARIMSGMMALKYAN